MCPILYKANPLEVIILNGQVLMRAVLASGWLSTAFARLIPDWTNHANALHKSLPLARPLDCLQTTYISLLKVRVKQLQTHAHTSLIYKPSAHNLYTYAGKKRPQAAPALCCYVVRDAFLHQSVPPQGCIIVPTDTDVGGLFLKYAHLAVS